MDEAHLENKKQEKSEGLLLPASIILAGALIASALIYTGGFGSLEARDGIQPSEEEIVPSEGIELPVSWRDLGIQMVRAGVIDREKFVELYASRGGLGEDEKKFLDSTVDAFIRITEENSGILLNLFWALGLGNKNEILERGPMADARYGGMENFASTAGWTLARGSAMDHYAKHSFLALTSEEQTKVERVSKNIFRPCCDNATYFPDCNHGMAMLGLLELMASQGMSELDMYKAALAVNSYWFPDTYLTIATYMKNKGIDWKNVNPQEILGINYSSASGYARVRAQVAEPDEQRGGSGCGVDTGETAESERQQSGCGT